MSYLNFTGLDYIIFSLWLFSFARIVILIGKRVNRMMVDKLKARWKEIAIETNSFRGRGCKYSLYENYSMKELKQVLSLALLASEVFGIVISITLFAMDFVFLTPDPYIMAPWAAFWYLLTATTVHLTAFIILVFTLHKLNH